MRLLKSQNLFLVGPMAVGKTTIGKLLAAELSLEFIDSDLEIERRAGADIPWIFDVEGEERFRQRETRVLEDLTQRKGILLATGGGSVLKNENRRILGSRGIVVYLETNVETQVRRTEKDKKRPLLQTGDHRKVLINLNEQRAPLYRQIADVSVFVGDSGSKKTVNTILKKLSQAELIED